jgi:hypothetical protein
MWAAAATDTGGGCAARSRRNACSSGPPPTAEALTLRPKVCTDCGQQTQHTQAGVGKGGSKQRLGRGGCRWPTKLTLTAATVMVLNACVKNQPSAEKRTGPRGSRGFLVAPTPRVAGLWSGAVTAAPKERPNKGAAGEDVRDAQHLTSVTAKPLWCELQCAGVRDGWPSWASRATHAQQHASYTTRTAHPPSSQCTPPLLLHAR